ncbi:MAG: ferredoxin family protein [Muribaculaceae bacterium]|nr:ferredoxin family protein [Muribaculaceae bacterium]
MKKDVRHPSFTSKNCTACWKCVEACPRHAIGRVRFLWHRHAVPHFIKCVGCNKCVAACPNNCFKAAASAGAGMPKDSLRGRG